MIFNRKLIKWQKGNIQKELDDQLQSKEEKLIKKSKNLRDLDSFENRNWGKSRICI